jgi:hypothetical protein
MKSGVARAGVALVSALSFSACILGVDPPPEASEETKAKYPDVVSATVGGVPWSAKVNDTWFDVVDLVEFSIGGRNSANYLGFRLRGVNRLGTYPIGGSTSPFATVDLRQNSIMYGNPTISSIGTVTVTELSPTRISGTFAFTALRITPITPGGMIYERTTMPVTNGTFSIAVYPNYSIPIAR